MVLNRGLNDENYSSGGEENSYTKALASAALDLKVAEP